MLERHCKYDLNYFLENERRFYDEDLKIQDPQENYIADLEPEEQIKEILYSTEINALVIREMLMGNISSFIYDW